ncbi:hypothetical protein GH714_029103 [Hevea brasiliensis]|uniref:2'-phosphotransferase n=1 Tax=Hevea brasiliensis TaxID=3981 RepID=A0A6A6KXR1_HEVBR|nr:hypothetical protein GH714_029103 [Hevea brasiliensis]
MRNHGERSRGHSGGGGGGKDKIDALGRLLTHILRHMATELNLNMRSDSLWQSVRLVFDQNNGLRND